MPFLPEKEHCQITGQVRGSNCTTMARDYTAIIIHNLTRTEERPGTGQAIPRSWQLLRWVKWKNMTFLYLILSGYDF